MKHNSHFNHQTDLPLNLQILNVSVNLARVSQWVVDGNKEDLVDKVVNQTDSYLSDLKLQNISEAFKPTLERFIKDFNKLKNRKITSENKLEWAERTLTWASILQHRAKLA